MIRHTSTVRSSLMLARAGNFIFTFIVLCSSCSYKSEKEVLNKWIPKNPLFLKLIGGVNSENAHHDCIIGLDLNDSVGIVSYFKEGSNGQECSSNKINSPKYIFIYSEVLPLSTFLKKNGFIPIHINIFLDTISNKNFDENNEENLVSNSRFEVYKDSSIIFYNNDNHKFYFLCHEERPHNTYIYCTELDKDEIFLQTKCE